MEQIVKKIKKQKILFGLESFLYIIFFLGILVLLNYISTRHYFRLDVTKTKIYSLSEKSINIIHYLDTNIAQLAYAK